MQTFLHIYNIPPVLDLHYLAPFPIDYNFSAERVSVLIVAAASAGLFFQSSLALD
jgi:hypothetical protein